ncbi:MAG: hypothetical protein P1V51_18980 [Deltaproteobacteria bacterium]|nr:hypothetical protein [Deltaproteobacteria bacterium]
MIVRALLLAAGLSLFLPPLAAHARDGTCKCTARCEADRCLGACSTLATEGACACQPGSAGGAAACETSTRDGPTLHLRRTRVIKAMPEARQAELWGCHPISLSPQPTWAVARFAPHLVNDTGRFASESVQVLGASSRELLDLGALSGNCRFEVVGWPEWEAGTSPALAVVEAVFFPGRATRSVEAWPVVDPGYLGKKVLPGAFTGPAVLRFKTDGTVLREVRLELVPGEKKKTHLFVQRLTEAVTLRRPSPRPEPAEGFLVAWLEQGRLVQLDVGAVFVPDPSPTAAVGPLP